MNTILRSIHLENLQKCFEKSGLFLRPTKAAIKSTSIKSYSACGGCSRRTKTAVEEYCEPKFKGNQLPAEKGSYHIVYASVEDRAEILELLMKTFLVDEPLIRASCMGRRASKDMQDLLLECLADNISLMAMSTSGKLLGVLLNANYSPTNTIDRKLEGLKKIKCRTTLEIMKLWAKIEREANLFVRWPVSHIFEMRTLATVREIRCMGVGRALIDRSREVAEELGYPLMRIDCTSDYSARASEGLGFTCVYQLDYKDYKDGDGKPVFNVEAPHDKIKIYTLNLE